MLDAGVWMIRKTHYCPCADDGIILCPWCGKRQSSQHDQYPPCSSQESNPRLDHLLSIVDRLVNALEF